MGMTPEQALAGFAAVASSIRPGQTKTPGDGSPGVFLGSTKLGDPHKL
jgi:hypothetical protein